MHWKRRANQRFEFPTIEPVIARKNLLIALVTWWPATGFQIRDQGFDRNLHCNQRARQRFEFSFVNSLFVLVTWCFRGLVYIRQYGFDYDLHGHHHASQRSELPQTKILSAFMTSIFELVSW